VPKNAGDETPVLKVCAKVPTAAPSKYTATWPLPSYVTAEWCHAPSHGAVGVGASRDTQ
jgi:hypothetical protein